MSHVDDVFQDNGPMIVDCDVLEAQKENVQPLAAGRRVTALSKILATPHSLRESKLASTRNRLRLNVEVAMEDEDGDALEAYSAFVHWTIENYPEGNSVESGLLELLEEATRVLKDHNYGRWRQEIRYLKLWLLYAGYIEKPTMIYHFLLANDIGTDHALLYEEYSAVLERAGRRKEADEIYILGIARNASPLDHLKSRHEDFQKRMMCQAPLPQPVPAQKPPAPLKTKSRAVLGTSASSGPSATITSRPTPSATRTGSSNAPIQVYVDRGDEPDDSATNPWPDVGTRKTRIKENVPEVKKLKGTTLKQKISSRAGSTSASGGSSGARIAIYRDPVPEEGDMSAPSVAAPSGKAAKAPSKGPPAVGGSVLPPMTPKFIPFRDEVRSPTCPAPESVMKEKPINPKLAAPISDAEALRKDPFKNYEDAAELAELYDGDI